MSTITIGFTNSTPILDDPEALKAQAEEDGYLYFKNLIPKDLIIQIRKQFLEVLDEYGWMDGSRPLEEGYVNQAAIDAEDPDAMTNQGVGMHVEAYQKIQKVELFHELPHHPNIINLYRNLLGGEVIPHPRHIARLLLPAAFNSPTPPHQDYIHIQGTKNVWTMWIPLGDCPRELGNLSVIRGSHKDGLLPVAAAQGAGGLEAHLCAGDYEWMEGDYEAGDAITFPSLTVHRGIAPQINDRVRLSLDYRFQRVDEEMDRGSLDTHGGIIAWEEVYKGWKNKDIQYYWKNYDLTFSEWDESIRWQKEKIC
jgi:ectoine hydroxylase-related dioxygenase (phytanoyl-CoA dioxygenase family)